MIKEVVTTAITYNNSDYHCVKRLERSIGVVHSIKNETVSCVNYSGKFFAFHLHDVNLIEDELRPGTWVELTLDFGSFALTQSAKVIDPTYLEDLYFKHSG